jgi:uncharacterized protein YfdQ (DUF2303 family)
MDNTAVQAIADLSAAKLAQDSIDKLSDISAIVIPNDYKLLSLEHLKPEPDHFRGQFSTNVLSQFISYLDQNGTCNTGVFINKEAMKAKAIIDMGNALSPEWGKHTAAATLERTPAYAALMRLADERMDQQFFIDFAEDWQDNLTFYFDDSSYAGVPEGFTFKQHINSLRKLTTTAKSTSENEIGNFAANRSALESIEISSGNDRPPTGFLFKVIPYDGFKEVCFDCSLRAMNNDDKSVRLKFRITALDQHQETIAEQFREKIESGIDVAEIKIFIGNMDYQK